MASATSPSSSSRVLDNTRSRLERAKFQYESLLMHAGSNFLVDEEFTGDARMTADLRASARSVPDWSASDPLFSRTQQHVSREGTPLLRRSEPELALSPNTRLSWSVGRGAKIDVPPMSNEEKNEIILQLQEENDRLKQKLNSVLDSAERNLQDAQETCEDITQDFDHRLSKLETRTRVLESENGSLKDMLLRTQRSLDFERSQLTQAVKIIEQFKKRSREYLDLQRKSQLILTTPEGLHYGMYIDQHNASRSPIQSAASESSHSHAPPPPPPPGAVPKSSASLRSSSESTRHSKPAR